MNNENVILEKTENGLLSAQDIQVLAQAGIIPPKTPPEQVAVFANICREKGLSPFSKEIYLVGYANNYSCITSINGFRKIAAQSGVHAGTDDVKFNIQPDGNFLTASQLIKAKQLPVTATVTVYRLIQSQRVPFTHTAVFAEFSSRKQKWASMPFQMIAKVAEAFALRKAFADRVSGISIQEEGAAINNENNIVLHKSKANVDTAKTLPEIDQVKIELRQIVRNYTDPDRDDLISDIKANENNLDGLKDILEKLRP